MSKYIVKDLYPTVSGLPKDKRKTKKIMNFITEYVDSNSHVLFERLPNKRLFLHDEHRKFFFDITGVKERDIKKVIKKIKFIKSGWHLLTNEFTFLLLIIIRSYHLNKDISSVKQVLFFLTLQYYTIQQSRYLRYVQDAVMEYTVSNLSNKHDLKKYGSIYAVLEKKVNLFYESYKDYLSSDDDKKLTSFLMNLNTRINQWMKGITREYMKNKDSGKYFNLTSDSTDEDDFRITSNLSLDITGTSNEIVIKLLEKGVLSKYVKISARINKIGYSSARQIISEIYKKNHNDIKVLTQYIFVNYFSTFKNKDRNDIRSKHFSNQSLMLYNQNNTTNKHVLKIKEILDKMLTEHSDLYTKTQRVTTKVNLRKCIYMYFVFAIQYVS